MSNISAWITLRKRNSRERDIRFVRAFMTTSRRTRIRCSRVAFPPKASIGETSAAAFITLSGMTLAERRVVGPPPVGHGL
jgi:hypothetical protein